MAASLSPTDILGDAPGAMAFRDELEAREQQPNKEFQQYLSAILRRNGYVRAGTRASEFSKEREGRMVLDLLTLCSPPLRWWGRAGQPVTEAAISGSVLLSHDCHMVQHWLRVSIINV